MGRRERVLVLYNEPVLPKGHPDYLSEVEVLDNVEAVQKVLTESGYEVARLGATSDPTVLINGIRDFGPDAVVNLFEGCANDNASELYACGLLEWLGVSYTGCPFHTLVLARSKHVAKRMFQAEGLPTAPFLVVEKAPVLECGLNFPVIVKPAQQDASVGVDQASVATDLEGLNRRVNYLLEQFGGTVLVEEFIFGRHPDGEAGIEMIMDALERHGFKGTFFLDVLSEYQFGAVAFRAGLHPELDEEAVGRADAAEDLAEDPVFAVLRADADLEGTQISGLLQTAPARLLLGPTQSEGNWTSPAFTITASGWNIGWAFQCTPAPTAGTSFQVFVTPAGSAPGSAAAISETGGSGQAVTAQTSLGKQTLVVEAPANCAWAVKVTGS